VPLTVPEALGGAEVKVPTLDGTKTLRVAPGTAHGTVQRLRGEGPPKLNSGSPPQKGDLHDRFTIDVPKDMSKEQRDAVAAMSKAFNGSDPRAGLFAGAAGAAGGAAGGAGSGSAGDSKGAGDGSS
jgi:molecular chaperone DnaJ